MRTILKNAHIVTPDEDFLGYIVLVDGIISDIQPKKINEGYDLDGKWLIPGCIDIHSDYWEKEIHPRPSANFPLDMAFHFMDQRAAACGLTTVFSAISFSYNVDKGRNFEIAIEKAKALGIHSHQALVRHYVHARLSPNTDVVLEALDQIKLLKALKLVVYNEDIPGQRQFTLDFVTERVAKKEGISYEEAKAKLEERIATLSKINHRPAIHEALGDLMVLGSHDDTTIAHVEEAKTFGCTLSEMPTTIEAARRAKELGLWVCMGAPNLVRGGSHCGNLSSLDAMAEGLVDMFCSDYHFPTMMTGVMKLLKMGVSPSQSIKYMSLNPAKFLSIDDAFGSIEVGKKADLVAFYPKGTFAKVEEVWIEGVKKFHCHPEGIF